MHRCRDFIPTVTGLRHRAQLRVLGTGIWFLGARPHSEKSSRLARGRDAGMWHAITRLPCAIGRALSRHVKSVEGPLLSPLTIGELKEPQASRALRLFFIGGDQRHVFSSNEARDRCQPPALYAAR